LNFSFLHFSKGQVGVIFDFLRHPTHHQSNPKAFRQNQRELFVRQSFYFGLQSEQKSKRTVHESFFLFTIYAFNMRFPVLLLFLARASTAFVIPRKTTATTSTRKSHLVSLHASRTIAFGDDGNEYDLLSLPARDGRPLKVILAGGGVGGLTAALCMLKKGFDVKVYERTAEFARFGGPIQFASNALSVLKDIDDDLFTRVMEKFTFTGTRSCGIKDGLRADGSFRMTNDSIDYLWNSDAPADWFVKFPLKVSKPRHAMTDCLLDLPLHATLI
jgi:hypothetical protein